MRQFFKLTALLVTLVCFAACTPDPDEPANVKRDITYMVDGRSATVHLNTAAVFDALLDRFCCWAEDGSTVIFHNANRTPKGHAAKDATTYSTTDREAMKRWMAQMEDVGKTVTVTYDPATGTWNGTAYATAPHAEDAFDFRGATHSLFTVSWDGRRIHFSRGNLQYRSTIGMWRFSDNQFSFHDESGDWMDIFTWEQGSAMPWRASTDTAFTGLTGDWRMLNEEEWRWMLDYRQCSTVGATENARWTPVTVAGVRGLLIFPDSYNHPDGVPLPVDINRVKSTSWDENDYSFGEWNQLEVAGAVFLPMAGYIKNDTTMYSNVKGRYWVYVDPSWFDLAALAIDTDLIPGLGGPEVGIIGWWNEFGASVRLVCNE